MFFKVCGNIFILTILFCYYEEQSRHSTVYKKMTITIATYAVRWDIPSDGDIICKIIFTL